MNKLIFLSLVFCTFSLTVLSAQTKYKQVESCDNAPILCGLAQLDGQKDKSIKYLNQTGPHPTLCFGNGVAQNTVWWSFLGNGAEFEIEVEIDRKNCENPGSGCSGLQVGVVKGCIGEPIDCNATCDDSKKDAVVLSGTSNNCQNYFIWIDGCCGDVCPYKIVVKKGKDQVGKIPLPLPNFTVWGSTVENTTVDLIQVGDLSQDCSVDIDWTIDGEKAPQYKNLKYIKDYQLGTEPVEFCVTWSLGNTLQNNKLCDQQTKCFTLTPKKVTSLSARIENDLLLRYDFNSNALVVKNPGVLTHGSLILVNTQSSLQKRYELTGADQSISMRDMRPGTYVAQITDGVHTKSLKFVKI